MIDILGYSASILLTLCVLPQAVKVFREKNADGLSLWFLIMWFFGILFMFIYAVLLNLLPVIINTSITLGVIVFIFTYKFKKVSYE